jgi:hypothetical protein
LQCLRTCPRRWVTEKSHLFHTIIACSAGTGDQTRANLHGRQRRKLLSHPLRLFLRPLSSFGSFLRHPFFAETQSNQAPDCTHEAERGERKKRASAQSFGNCSCFQVTGRKANFLLVVSRAMRGVDSDGPITMVGLHISAKTNKKSLAG